MEANTKNPITPAGPAPGESAEPAPAIKPAVYCEICKEKVELREEVGKGEIFYRLSCQHIWNKLTGWCCEKKKIKHPEEELVKTVLYLYLRYFNMRNRFLQVLNEETKPFKL